MEQHIRNTLMQTLEQLSEVRAEREEAERAATEYLNHVRAKVEADLSGIREREEELRLALQHGILEHNNGKTFKVPGLGSATITRRKNLTVTDEEVFLTEYAERNGGVEDLYDHRLSRTRVKEAAKRALNEDGELLPGIEQTETDTLSVRF